MRSTQLAGNQLKALCERVAPMADYLKRLQGRMAKQCFADNDPLASARSGCRG